MGSSSSHCQHGRLLKYAPCMHRRWHSLSSEKGKQTMLFGVLEQSKEQTKGEVSLTAISLQMVPAF